MEMISKDKYSSNLMCTVGTSLFHPNLEHLYPQGYLTQLRSGSPPVRADLEALTRHGVMANPDRLITILESIRAAYHDKQYSRIAGLFLNLPPELRLLGAEINSIEAMVRKHFLSDNRARLILLISDTKDGQAIGEILSGYFEHPDCPIGFSRCLIEPVIGLQDQNPLVFQREGLANLARLLGDFYRQLGGAVAINATGGYKAQIALAVAFGQAAKIPVYYKHERFDQIIRFPQIPFSLDLGLVQNHLKLWADLAEPESSFAETDLQTRLTGNATVMDEILPLLDFIEDNGEKLFCLSALGMVYWEAFRSMHPELTLQPGPVLQRRGCHFRDDHYPDGFRDHVKRVYDAFPAYISQCHALAYDKQRSIQPGIYQKQKQIVGEYVDSNRFGARFEIMTSAQNSLERQWLIDRFNA